MALKPRAAAASLQHARLRCEQGEPTRGGLQARLHAELVRHWLPWDARVWLDRKLVILIGPARAMQVDTKAVLEALRRKVGRVASSALKLWAGGVRTCKRLHVDDTGCRFGCAHGADDIDHYKLCVRWRRLRLSIPEIPATELGWLGLHPP